MVIFVAELPIVINLSPAPFGILFPSKMVEFFPAPIILTFETANVISSSLTAEYVPVPTFITPPQVGNCEIA